MTDIIAKDYDGPKEGYEYFVSVIDGPRYGFLLGPYPTYDEALANVRRGKDLARPHDIKSFWYEYGTCGAPIGTITKTVFGR